mgnify:FL=1
MRQVFYSSPWIHEPEPEELFRIYAAYGERIKVKAGADLPYSGEDALVCYLEKGLGAFSYLDKSGHKNYFAIIVPKRTFGDLVSLTQNRMCLKGEILRDSTLIILKRKIWEEQVMKSVATLSCYVRNAISKEESHMEGMIANSTLELPERILSFSYALINAYYPPKLEDWNPLPVTLTLTEISRVVAANRTSVSLIISDWIKDGNAQKKGRQLLIHGRLFQNLYDRSCSFDKSSSNP